MVTTAELFAASIHDAKAIGKISSYYCGGYYSEGGSVDGYWCGDGAESLGLKGVVKQAHLFHLLRGLSADGTSQLVRTQSKKSDTRKKGQDRAGLDITMSVPKSVSILWAYGTPWIRREVELAFDRSCKEAFRLLEEQCFTVRSGKGGSTWEHGKLIAAMFDHYTARNAHDPQLHRHFVIPNIAINKDGYARKLNTMAILGFIRTLGPLFRNILLTELRESLGVEGYRPLKKGVPVDWFELRGIPENLIDKLSSRRNEITAEVESNGTTVADFSAKQSANLHTRQSKDPTLDLTELQRVWDEKAVSLGITREQFQQCIGREIAPVAEDEIRNAVDKAVAAMTVYESSFDELLVVRKTSELLQDRPIKASKIIGEVKEQMKQSPFMKHIQGNRRTTIFTTQAMWKLESETRDLIEKLASRPGLAIAPKFIERAIYREKEISEEQVNAAKEILKSTGSLACLTGIAGAGKSTTLRTVVNAARRAGRNIIGVSLSGVAAENLAQSAGVEARTIASFLKQTEKTMVQKIATSTIHHVEMFLRVARGRKTWQPRKLKLNSKSIILLDEAGMVDTVLGRRLLIQAERAGASVIAIGDLAQLKPIGAGTPFRTMIERVGSAELKKNWRQTEIEAKASELVREGAAEDALKIYAGKGDLKISRDRDSAIATLIKDWKDVGLKSPNDAAILAQTNREVALLNRLCQQERLKEKVGGRRSIKLSNCSIYTGDRVRFGETSHFRGIKNGYTATVLSIDYMGNATLKLDKKMTREDRKRGHRSIVKLSPKELLELEVDLGYASTVHAFQGVSIAFVYVLAGGKMQDQSLTYVSLSRSTARCRLYLDRHHAGAELCNMVKAMKRRSIKENAIDIHQKHTQSLSNKE